VQSVAYLLFWALLFFVMMRFGCGAHMMGHHHHRDHSHGDDGDRFRTPIQARDPVCGMTVATAEAKSALIAGRAYYFCSQTCRDKFEASPAAYVQPETPDQMEGVQHGAA
jgi:YHS domain-containing protein